MHKFGVNNLTAHQNMLLYITRSMENKLEFFTIIWHIDDFFLIGQYIHCKTVKFWPKNSKNSYIAYIVQLKSNLNMDD